MPSPDRADRYAVGLHRPVPIGDLDVTSPRAGCGHHPARPDDVPDATL
jgi:hypothetical protein